MVLDSVVSAFGGNPAKAASRILGRGVPVSELARGSKSNNVDGVEVSEKARQAYKNDADIPEKTGNFENTFKEALIRFTRYALDLNGFNMPPDGKHILLALNVLAQKSRIQIPENLQEGGGEALRSFQSAWQLDKDASAEQIFQQMVRVFGEDRSFGLNGASEGRSLSRPDAGRDTGVEDALSVVNDKFREALAQFTARLLEKAGIMKDPDGRDYNRTLNILAEKTGLSARDPGLISGITSAMGAGPDSSVSDFVTGMMRIFGL